MFLGWPVLPAQLLVLPAQLVRLGLAAFRTRPGEPGLTALPVAFRRCLANPALPTASGYRVTRSRRPSRHPPHYLP
jgi:hypothetical protein